MCKRLDAADQPPRAHRIEPVAAEHGDFERAVVEQAMEARAEDVHAAGAGPVGGEQQQAAVVDEAGAPGAAGQAPAKGGAAK